MKKQIVKNLQYVLIFNVDGANCRWHAEEKKWLRCTPSVYTSKTCVINVCWLRQGECRKHWVRVQGHTVCRKIVANFHEMEFCSFQFWNLMFLDSTKQCRITRGIVWSYSWSLIHSGSYLKNSKTKKCGNSLLDPRSVRARKAQFCHLVPGNWRSSHSLFVTFFRSIYIYFQQYKSLCKVSGPQIE